MKVIILAAGEGRRLHPYTAERPKCLVPLRGTSLIDYQRQAINQLGIRETVLITGYREAQLQNKATRTYHNPDYATSNMVWTLFCARKELEGDAIIAYGDIIYAPSVLAAVAGSDKDIAVAVDLDWESYWRARFLDPLRDAETLELAEDGSITNIGQKPHAITQMQAQYVGLIKISAVGSQIFCRCFDEALTRGSIRTRTAYMTDFLQMLIDHGEKVWPVPITGKWLEIDTVNDLMLAESGLRLNEILPELVARS